VKALDDVNLVSAYANEGASLMLAIFELPLLVSSKLYAKRGCDFPAKLLGSVQCKDIHEQHLRI
jgi:hypothetical protein